MRTHVVPQFCLVNLDHHHITIVCQVLIESLRVGSKEFPLFHQANLFSLERRASTQHLPRNVHLVEISKIRRFSVRFICVLVQKGDESSESSQKKVRNAFVVLDSLHSHRLGQVSRAVNVATPAEENIVGKRNCSH